jgi:cyclophilin family peptidyl-prolyl cis-trans isomerase/HEAT repeat protein
MRLSRTFSPLLLVLTACASAPPAPPAPPPASVMLTETEIDLLADLLRREDNRQYDSAAFHGFLSSPNETLRLLSVRALGRIGNQAAAAPLLRSLADSSVAVRAEAAFALGELGDSSASVINALGTLQAEGEPGVEAIGALGKLRTEYARTVVEHVLTQGAAPPRLQEALLASWRFPRRPATTQLIVRYARHADQQTRWRAIYALTRNPAEPSVVPLLLDVVRTDSGYAAAFAARGLRAATADSAGRRREATAALLTRINDAAPAVRTNALTALIGYRDSTIVPQLLPLLRHSQINTRVAAAQAVGAAGGAQAWTALEALARSGGERAVVRGTALNGLIGLDARRALPLAQEFARSSEWLLRLYAARAGGAADSELALPLWRSLAGDRDVRVVVAAVEAAAGARDTLPAARALFIEQLAAADPFVRAAALSGLQRYADPADQILLFDAYARAQRDTVPEAAVAALDAIGRLVQRNAAVERAFRIRFPQGSECPHPDVRRALNRHFQVPDSCGFAATSRVYEQAVRNLIVPALQGTNPRARVHTAGGVIEIELLAAAAPLTVRNFLTLADSRYFDRSRWHRVVPNFVLQDGDPYGNGSGGPGYAIRDEMNRVRYLEGTVGMALSGPDTGGSQFFITHSPQPHLDGGYTVFGRVTPASLPLIHLVAQDDVIERIEIVR